MVPLYMVIFVALTIGQVSSKSPCCVPDQWEAKMGGLTDSGREMFGYYSPKMSVDFKRLKMAVQEIVAGDKWMRNISVIIDYKAKSEWIIDWKEKSCHKMPLPGTGQPQKCIPPNYKFQGTLRLGFQNNAVNADNWISPTNEGNLVSFLVTSDTCVPMSEFMDLHGKEHTVVAETIYDVTLGIQDPSVFNLPSFCEKATLATRLPVQLSQSASYWLNRFIK